MITSAENRGWRGDLGISDLRSAGLPAPSIVCPAKIATVEARDALRLGTLPHVDRGVVASCLRGILSGALEASGRKWRRRHSPEPLCDRTPRCRSRQPSDCADARKAPSPSRTSSARYAGCGRSNCATSPPSAAGDRRRTRRHLRADGTASLLQLCLCPPRQAERLFVPAAARRHEGQADLDLATVDALGNYIGNILHTHFVLRRSPQKATRRPRRFNSRSFRRCSAGAICAASHRAARGTSSDPLARAGLVSLGQHPWTEPIPGKAFVLPAPAVNVLWIIDTASTFPSSVAKTTGPTHGNAGSEFTRE